jgi:hypothetical protein
MIAEVVPINVRWKQLFPEMENNLSAAKSQLGINPDSCGYIPSFPFLITNYLHLLSCTSVILRKLSREFLSN